MPACSHLFFLQMSTPTSTTQESSCISLRGRDRSYSDMMVTLGSVTQVRTTWVKLGVRKTALGIGFMKQSFFYSRLHQTTKQ